jgi:magnesium transporter
MHRSRQISPERLPPGPSPLHQDYMLPDSMVAPSRSASFTDMGVLYTTRKGKEKERNLRSQISSPISASEIFESNRAPKAWWLDVCSPTWEDMRAIGRVNNHNHTSDDAVNINLNVQLLHLHPLTLEDILQQEPREKLELFPRLGYYFVSFRAIESQATRERFRRFNTTEIYHNECRDDRGAVGEVSIYLVVFREGVCSVS